MSSHELLLLKTLKETIMNDVLSTAIKDHEDFFEMLSTLSSILGVYENIDPNTRSEDFEDYLKNGPRTEVDWSCGVRFVFEPEAIFTEGGDTMMVMLDENWDEGRRNVGRNRQFQLMKNIRYLVIMHGFQKEEVA